MRGPAGHRHRQPRTAGTAEVAAVPVPVRDRRHRAARPDREGRDRVLVGHSGRAVRRAAFGRGEDLPGAGLVPGRLWVLPGHGGHRIESSGGGPRARGRVHERLGQRLPVSPLLGHAGDRDRRRYQPVHDVVGAVGHQDPELRIGDDRPQRVPDLALVLPRRAGHPTPFEYAPRQPLALGRDNRPPG